jgi:hypothetical protein
LALGRHEMPLEVLQTLRNPFLEEARSRRHQIHAATHAKSSTPSSIHKGEPSTGTRTEVYLGYGLPADLKHLSCTSLSWFKNIKLGAIARTRKHARSKEERLFGGSRAQGGVIGIMDMRNATALEYQRRLIR